MSPAATRTSSTPVNRLVALPGGLVDAHFHATLDFAGLALDRGLLPQRNRRAQFEAGVLAMRDVGQPPDAPSMIERQDARMRAAGTILAAPGRGYPQICEFLPPERVRAAAVAQARRGADWVKIMFDFPGADGDFLGAPASFGEGALREIVDAVHAEGARVTVHSTGPDVALAVRAGVDCVEHGVQLDPATVEMMAAGGVGLVPTRWTARKHMDPVVASGGAPARAAVAALDRHRDMVRLAVALGAPVLAGSDETPAGGLHLELAALVEDGLMSAADAVAAATTVARAFLRIPVPSGDVVLYDGDPSEDIRVLAAPVEVRLGGAPLLAE